MRIIFSILLLIAVNGCVLYPSHGQVFPEEFANGNKTIVIIRSFYKENSKEYPISAYWHRLDKNYGTDRQLKYDFTLSPDVAAEYYVNRPKDVVPFLGYKERPEINTETKILMVEPGTYVLDSFGVGQYRNGVSGWDKDTKKVQYASFEAKAGEVLYVGDVGISITKLPSKSFWQGPNHLFDIKINDNFAHAKKVFAQTYPTIKTPVIKRLAIPGEAAFSKRLTDALNAINDAVSNNKKMNR